MGNQSPEKFTQWIAALLKLIKALLNKRNKPTKEEKFIEEANHSCNNIIAAKQSKVINKVKGLRYRRIDEDGEPIFESSRKKQTPPKDL